MASRRGRHSKPYRTSQGEEIQGLYHCPDGRWRIVATGERFTEPDETRAVAKFQEWQSRNDPYAGRELVGRKMGAQEAGKPA